MEEWYNLVRNFKDESESPYLTKQFINQVFQELKRSRIREKKKFIMRTGSEFESWALHLEEQYPQALVREILNDDEFWNLTLKVSGVV